jgi:hypothetical protein
MKDTMTDASRYFRSQIIVLALILSLFVLDFPRTADQRVYHLGVRPGEVANRIVKTEKRTNVFSSDVLECCR